MFLLTLGAGPRDGCRIAADGRMSAVCSPFPMRPVLQSCWSGDWQDGAQPSNRPSSWPTWTRSPKI